MNNVMFSSFSDNWATPQYLFDMLNNEFHFTLDVCASDDNHKCDKYFTKYQNGLLQNWGHEIVFCNPPYGRSIKNWVKKCYFHPALSVMLLPARTDTVWFHDYIYQKDFVEVRFLRGRLRFGNSEKDAPFPSMIVIFYY